MMKSAIKPKIAFEAFVPETETINSIDLVRWCLSSLLIANLASTVATPEETPGSCATITAANNSGVCAPPSLVYVMRY